MLTLNEHQVGLDFGGRWRPDEAHLLTVDSGQIGPNFVGFKMF